MPWGRDSVPFARTSAEALARTGSECSEPRDPPPTWRGAEGGGEPANNSLRGN